MTTSTFDLDFFRLINGLAGTNQVLDFVAVFAARWLIYVLVGAVVWLGLMSWCRLREGVDSTTAVSGLVIGLRTMVVVLLSAMDSLIMTLVVFRLRPFASLDGVHFPIDVLVGAALGTSWAVAVAVIGKKFDDRDRLLQFLLRKRTPSMDFHDQS